MAALVAVSALSVIGFVALLTMTGIRLRAERNHALAQEEAARQSLYAGNIYLAQQALNSGNLGLARHTLAAHQPAPGRKDLRGFEWRYLWSRCQGDQVATMRGHASAVACVSFSSDGRWLASGGDDRTIRVWDVETREVRLSLARFDDAVVAVAFSPDGRQIIAGTADAVVTTLDLKTRSVVRTCRAYGQVTLAPASDRAAFSWTIYPKTGREDVVTLYDLDSTIALHTLRQAGGHAAVSHDGRRVATAGPSGIKLWDAESGRVLAEMTEGKPLSAFFFSRDDRLLAAFANDGRSIQVWEVATGARRAEFAVPEAKFHSADFSPDGQSLATCGTDQSIHLWNLTTHAMLASLKGDENEVRAVVFSPDGRWLASAGKDGAVRLWKAGVPDTPSFPTNAFPVCALSSDGKLLATQDRLGRSTNVNVMLWDVASWQPRPLPNSRGAQPVAFLERDATLLTMRRPVSGDVLWLDFYDLARGSNRTSLSLTNSNRPRTSIDYAPRTGWFALASYDGEILVWRVADGQLLATLRSPSNEMQAIRFSPDGRTLASFIKDAGITRITLWDVVTGKERFRLAFQAARADYLAFSADGTVLAAADSNNAIDLWNAATGAVLTTFTGHPEPVVRLAFAPDGQTLASASEDGMVKLWSLPARRELATIFRGGTLAHLEFTPDGQTLFGTGTNGHLHSWRAPPAK